jgi:oligogalacturonide lyase
MKIKFLSQFYILFFIVILFTSCTKKIPVIETGSQKPMPEKWVDASTKHKIVRLSSIETDNRSFYFHNNPFIPELKNEGDLMVYYSSKQKRPSDRIFKEKILKQLFVVNLKTFETKQLTNHQNIIAGEIVAKKRREVFYQTQDTIFAVNVDNQNTRIVFIFPDSIKRAGISSLNADETLIAGSFSDDLKDSILRNNPNKSDYFKIIYEAKLKHTIFVIDIEKGTIEYILSDNAWLNHIQFSPTDPYLLMFCHEGPWHLVDRIWTINIKEKKPRLMHKRSVKNEIAGHEFFSCDGKTIWFDLQIPRSKTFYLAGVNIESGQLRKYSLKRDEWSIHYNISPNQKLFTGDGGDSSQVAKAKNGQWIYLFTPKGDSIISEKLVNMKFHDYSLEPNVHFSPDGKWVIFRANFEGSSQVYAVKIHKEILPH